MPGFVVTVAGRLSFGLRCATALVFGGAIPLAVLLAGAAIFDATGSSTWGLASSVAVCLSVVSAAVIVEVGRAGLRALERGWRPFLPYPVMVTVALGMTHHLAGPM